MKKTFKNCLSLLLTLAMVFSVLGMVPVMAEDEQPIPAGELFEEIQEVAVYAERQEESYAVLLAEESGEEQEESGETEFYISDADELFAFAASVDGGTTYEGCTVYLTADIDLNNALFNPIGSYKNDKAFKGIFDGQGYTISNLSQNTWELDTGYYYTDLGLGLFGLVEDATIKNLTIDGAEISGESAICGTVAACAYGDCTFDNITIKNANVADYQYYAGGIVGWASGDHVYSNCWVDESTTVGGQWGDFDNSNGGMIGGCGGNATILIKDSTVACRIDAYNDVTSTYQWYAYRRSGMLIGNTSKFVNENGTNYSAAPQLTAENVTVVYGDWAEYTYCEFAGTSWPYVRCQAGISNSAYSNPRYGHPTDANGNTVVDDNHVHNDGEDHMILCEFNQLYGGGQGVYGEVEHEGVVAYDTDDTVISARIGGRSYVTLAEAIEAAEAGDTVVLLADVDELTIDKAITVDVNGNDVGAVVLADAGAVVIGENLNVTTNVSGMKVKYADGVYTVVKKPANKITLDSYVAKNNRIYVDLDPEGKDTTFNVTYTIYNNDDVAQEFDVWYRVAYNNSARVQNKVDNILVEANSTYTGTLPVTIPAGTDISDVNQLRLHLRGADSKAGSRDIAYTTKTFSGVLINGYYVTLHNNGGLYEGKETDRVIFTDVTRSYGSIAWPKTDGSQYSREGYTFVGFADNAEGEGTIYTVNGLKQMKWTKYPCRDWYAIWEIVEVPVEVTIADAEMVLGNDLPDFSYTVDPEIEEELDITYTVVDANDEPVESITEAGEYIITAEVAENDNYKFTVVTGKLTVLEAVAEVDGVYYASIQDAIDAAESGDTVVLLKDVELDPTSYVAVGDEIKVLLYVEGKDITLDLNENEISLNHEEAFAIYAVVLVADGAGLTVTGDGEIDVEIDADVTVGGTKNLYYMFWKRGTTGSLVIENGTFHMNDAEDSMIYTNTDKKVEVKGGTFTLDATGNRSNGHPWIFNTQGKNARAIVVSGGTYNADVSNQYWTAEVAIADGYVCVDNGNGTWTVEKVPEKIDLTVTFDNLTMVAGNELPELTYAVEGELADGDTITVSVDADGTVAGEYAITVTVTNPEKYNLTVVSGTLTVKEAVAAVNGVNYASLTDAIAAAAANDTITFLADITEDVTISKNLTIDGDEFDYTGTMTLNKVNVTIEEVDFVKGNIYKNKKTGVGGNYTIKNCTFDGQGLNNYAVNLGGTSKIVIENCTAKNYGYGFLQVPASNTSVSVKNVEISDVNYGFKIDYSNGVTLENITITDINYYGIYDSNYSAKTYTIKNCDLSSIEIWDRNTGKTDTFVFEGDNTITGEVNLKGCGILKFADADTTLAAPEGLEIITDIDGMMVARDAEGVYRVVPVSVAVDVIVTFDDAEMVAGNELPKFTYTTNFTEVAEDGTMLVVEEPVVEVNGAGEYEITANAYVFMNDTYVVTVVPGTLNVLEAVAAVNGVYYATFEDALANADEGDTVVLEADCEADDIIIPAGVTLDLNGYTLTADKVTGEAGSNLIDSVGGGKLICDEVTLAEENEQLPVYVEDGYIFFDLADEEDWADLVELLEENGSEALDLEVFVKWSWKWMGKEYVYSYKCDDKMIIKPADEEDDEIVEDDVVIEDDEVVEDDEAAEEDMQNWFDKYKNGFFGWTPSYGSKADWSDLWFNWSQKWGNQWTDMYQADYDIILSSGTGVKSVAVLCEA